MGKHLLKYSGVVPLDCDVKNPLAIERAIKYTKPDLVVHLAGRSDVNYCQQPENERDIFLTNVRGTCHVAEAVERYGCGMVFLSSDHVFSGKKWWGKYEEGDKVNPINQYGMTKIMGEGFQKIFKNIKIVRTSYLFDAERLKPHKILKAYPTFIKRGFLYLPHFAALLYAYCLKFDEQPEILHLSGSEIVSWYRFMRDLSKAYGLSGDVVEPRKKEWANDFAPRGKRLGLDISLSQKLGFGHFSYLDGLKEMATYENV